VNVIVIRCRISRCPSDLLLFGIAKIDRDPELEGMQEESSSIENVETALTTFRRGFTIHQIS